MKNTFFKSTICLAIALFSVLFLFQNCNKEGSDAAVTPEKRVRSMVTLNSNERTDYYYDDKGRLVEEKDGNGFRTTYVYSDTKITQNEYENGAFKYSINWNLNSRGLVTGTDLPNGESYTLQYDSEDHLVKIIATRPNGYVSEVDFIFSGGNCIKYQNSPINSYMVKEYREDRNTLSNENFGRMHMGKESKDLVQSETFTNSDGSKVITFYDYDLDNEGYVIKQYAATHYPNSPSPSQSQIAYYYE